MSMQNTWTHETTQDFKDDSEFDVDIRVNTRMAEAEADSEVWPTDSCATCGEGSLCTNCCVTRNCVR